MIVWQQSIVCLSSYEVCAVSKAFGTVMEKINQSISPGCQLVFSPARIRQIVCFMRIVLQIEKVFPTGLRIPHVLMVSVGYIVISMTILITAGVLTVQAIPHTVGVSAHDRKQTPTSTSAGNLDIAAYPPP